MALLMQENPALAGLIRENPSHAGLGSLQCKTCLPGHTLVDRSQSLGLTLGVYKGFVRVTFFSSAEDTTAVLGPGSLLRVTKCNSPGQPSLSITSESLSQVYIAYQ